MPVELLPIDTERAAEEYCRALEEGAILFLPVTPLERCAADRDAVLAAGDLPLTDKNISYRRSDDRLHGIGGDCAPLRRLMRSYVDLMTARLATLLAPYAPHWRIEATSYRPLEEAGRQLPWKARNDLLHIDAFP